MLSTRNLSEFHFSAKNIPFKFDSLKLKITRYNVVYYGRVWIGWSGGRL